MKEVKRSHSGFGNRHYSESKHDTETRLNKTPHPREFNKRQGYVIGILCLLVLSIGLGVWTLSPSNGLFHSYVSDSFDPFTPIWSDNGASCVNNQAPLSFNVFKPNSGNVICTTNCVGTTPCLALGSNSTHDAIAITKSTIGDLGIAHSKNLLMQFSFTTTSTVTANVQWGFYLTTNSTLPSTPNYNPKNDPSVVFLQNFACGANCNVAGTTDIVHRTWMLRTLGNGDTLASEDTSPPEPCNGNEGSQYFCYDKVINPTVPILNTEL